MKRDLEMATCDTSFAHLSDLWRTVFGIINTAIAVVAFIGNVTAFLVIFKTKYFRNLSTCFLCSLIMTDLLVGVMLEPMHAAQLVSQVLRNNCGFNSVRRYLSTLLIGASVSSIALISYDRYLHLSTTQNYSQYMTKKKAAVLIILGWAIPAIVPTLREIGKNDQIYSAIAFVFTCLCFIVIIVSYTFIIKIVRKKETEMVDSQIQNQMQQHRIKNDIRAAKVVTIIIICFVITIIPGAIYFCIVAVKAFLPDGIPGFNKESEEIYYTVILALAMANSGINPLIYYLRNPKFKKSLVKKLKGFCPARCSKKSSCGGNAALGTTSNSVELLV